MTSRKLTIVVLASTVILYIYIYIYIYISEQIRKNCAITFSLCAGRSPGQSLPRPAKSEGAWRQTAHHGAPRGPSFVTIGESWVWDSIQGGIVRLNISCAVQKI